MASNYDPPPDVLKRLQSIGSEEPSSSEFDPPPDVLERLQSIVPARTEPKATPEDVQRLSADISRTMGGPPKENLADLAAIGMVPFGYGPEVTARLNTLGQKLGFRPGEPNYQENLARVNANLADIYGKHPIAAPAAEIAGGLVPAIAGGMGAGIIGSKIAEGIGTVLPDLGVLNKLAGPVGRGITRGGVEGLGGSVITTRPEDLGKGWSPDPWDWTATQWGGALGAGIGGVVSGAIPLASELGKTKIGKDVSAKVQDLWNRGIFPLPHQVVEGTDQTGSFIKDAAKRLGVSGGRNQLEAVTKETSRFVGNPTTEIGDTFIQDSLSRIGQTLDNFENRLPNYRDPALVNRVNTLAREAQRAFRLPPNMVNKELATVQNGLDAIRRNAYYGTLNGQTYKTIKDGPLSTLLNSSNASIVQFGKKAKQALEDSIERAVNAGLGGLTPADIAAYKQAKGQYRDMMALKPVFEKARNTGGLVSPKDLQSQKLRDAKGDLGRFSESVSLLKDVSPTKEGGVAAPRGESPSFSKTYQALSWLGHNAEKALFGLGATGYGAQAMLGSAGTLGQPIAAAAAILGAGATGARAIRSHVLRNMLEHPGTTNRLLPGAYPGPVTSEASTVRRVAPAAAPDLAKYLQKTRDDRQTGVSKTLEFTVTPK